MFNNSVRLGVALIALLSAFNCPGQGNADGVEVRDMLLCTDTVVMLCCVCKHMLATLNKLRKVANKGDGRLSAVPGPVAHCMTMCEDQFVTLVASVTVVSGRIGNMHDGVDGKSVQSFTKHYAADDGALSIDSSDQGTWQTLMSMTIFQG